MEAKLEKGEQRVKISEKVIKGEKMENVKNQ